MNAIATTPPSSDEVIRVLQNSLYPGAKRESVELVLSYCKVNQLDPMLKPVHIVPTRSKIEGTDDWETRDTLMPGIALYRILAARSGEYGGKSEPEFGHSRTENIGGVEVTYPEWCRVTVSRIVKGQLCSFAAKELWLENFAAVRKTGAPNEMWQRRAYGQLAKCAEAQALRMAFPEYSGGAPTAEEMEGKEGFNGTTIEAQPEPPRAAAATTPEAPLKRQTLREWMTEFDARCAAAQTPEDASKVLDAALVMADFLSTRPAALAQYNDIRAACIARLWPEPPDDLPEVEIRGEANVGAG